MNRQVAFQQVDVFASQGYCVGRKGKVEVRLEDNGNILIGGHAVTCIEGTLNT